MPKKSKRVKMFQNKRRQERQLSSVTPARPQVVTPAQKPVVAAPKVSAPTARTTPVTVHSFYVVAEMKRIGILAGIIMAILIVLALVLP